MANIEDWRAKHVEFTPEEREQIVAAARKAAKEPLLPPYLMRMCAYCGEIVEDFTGAEVVVHDRCLEEWEGRQRVAMWTTPEFDSATGRYWVGLMDVPEPDVVVEQEKVKEGAESR